MGTAMYDSLEDMKELLKDKWGTTALIGDTPDIQVVWERKVVGFADYARDTILLQPKTEKIDYFGLYGSDFLHNVEIQIDIWTYMNQTRLDNMVKEVTKIIKNNIRRTDFVDLMLMSSISSSDTYRNIWKHVLTVRYRKHNPE